MGIDVYSIRRDHFSTRTYRINLYFKAMKIRTKKESITGCKALVNLERPIYGLATLPSGEVVPAVLKRDGGHPKYFGNDEKRIPLVKHFEPDPPQEYLIDED